MTSTSEDKQKSYSNVREKLWRSYY